MVKAGENVFLFNFYNEKTDESKNFSFKINTTPPEQVAELNLINMGDHEEFNDFVSDREGDFGVHDVSFSDEEFYGFTSYEVKPKQYEKLMHQWRKFFLKRGFTISNTEISID